MTSEVWKHFKIDGGNNHYARCNICSKLVSRGGSNKTTSNLIKHIKTHSINVLQGNTNKQKPKTQILEENRPTKPKTSGTLHSFLEPREKRPIGLNEPSTSFSAMDMDEGEQVRSVSPHYENVVIVEYRPNCEEDILHNNLSDYELGLRADVSSSESISNSQIPPSPYPKPIKMDKKKQVTLKSAYDKITKFKTNDERAKIINILIAEMICLDLQPFSIVENKGFLRLLNHLEPRYTIPSRKTFSNKILTEMYMNIALDVKSELGKANYVAVTTDMWTSIATQDYMAVSAHFFKEEESSLKLTHKCLDVIPFPEISHTGDNILKFLTTVFNDWGIDKKIVGVVRDNGTDITAALNRSTYEAIPCVAHTLQLVIKDGLMDTLKLSNLIKKARKLVGSYKHSSKNMKILKSVQKQLGLPEHRMIQDEPTRWNSTYHMYKRLLEQKDALIIMSSKNEVHISTELTTDDWKTMAIAVDVLEIFENATLQLSKETSSVSEIIPLIHTIVQVLGNLNVAGSGLQGLKNGLISSMKLRYPTIEGNLTLAVATLLDPRFKDTPFESQSLLQQAKEKVLSEMEGLNPTSSEVETAVTSAVSEPEDSSKNVGFWAKYSTKFGRSVTTSLHHEVRCTEELQQFLNEQNIHPEDGKNIGNYWCSSPHKRLKQIAIKYLCIPPATVYSERLFSTAGNICDRKRNRLDPERVKMLVFLNKNLE